MDKNTERQVMQSFIRSMCNVFSTLTEKKLVPRGVEQSDTLVVKVSGVVVIVSFSGLFSGRLLVSMPKELTGIIYKGLGGENPSDDDLLLAANEFGNMVAGNAVTEINNIIKGANIRLSPPSSFIGDDLVFFNFKMSAHNILFDAENLTIRLNVALKEEK